MRLGEVLPLRPEDFDGETLQVRRTAHEGRILEGTKTDHGEEDAGRVVPVPATLAWMLEAQINLNGPDCELLFPTPRGRLWRERNFYRDVWKPAQEASGLDIRPHECRHSYVTHLAPLASTTPTWPRSLGTGSRRCWRATPMRLEKAMLPRDESLADLVPRTGEFADRVVCAIVVSQNADLAVILEKWPARISSFT